MRKPIFVCWIGDGPQAPLTSVRRRILDAFDAPVTLFSLPRPPDDAWDPRRRQHASSRLLVWLCERCPAAAAKVLGITDRDLFVPSLTYVFGEAQLGGRAAVVSTARLSGTPLFEERLAKEAVHELGHAFGLPHCGTATCVMRRSSSVAEVDRRSAGLCLVCRHRLSSPRTLGDNESLTIANDRVVDSFPTAAAEPSDTVLK